MQLLVKWKIIFLIVFRIKIKDCKISTKMQLLVKWKIYLFFNNWKKIYILNPINSLYINNVFCILVSKKGDEYLD